MCSLVTGVQTCALPICEVRLDRVEAGLVDRCLVHARAVQPADLLFDRAGGGLVGAGVRRFDDAALCLQALLAQLVERAPADEVRGDRVGLDPRPEARRVGKEWGRTCRCRLEAYHTKNKPTKQSLKHK